MADIPKRLDWLTDDMLDDPDLVPLEIDPKLRPEYEGALAEFDRRFGKMIWGLAPNEPEPPPVVGRPPS